MSGTYYVEAMSFADRFSGSYTVQVVAGSRVVADAITQLYAAYCDRAPDAAGEAYWVDRLHAGMTIGEIAKSFAGQQESRDLYGYLATLDATDSSAIRAFVGEIYANLFDRVPDAAGEAYWMAQVSSGSDRGTSVILDIISGARGHDVVTIDNKVLNAYRVEFHDLSLRLDKGKQYWMRFERGKPVSSSGTPQAPLTMKGATDRRGDYQPSPDSPRLLFMGPFRYAPNLNGLLEFLDSAWPVLRRRFPALQLTVLGGEESAAVVAREPRLRQPGVEVLSRFVDPAPHLAACSLSINPQRDIRGSSIKLIESLLAGRVCVSSRMRSQTMRRNVCAATSLLPSVLGIEIRMSHHRHFHPAPGAGLQWKATSMGLALQEMTQ